MKNLFLGFIATVFVSISSFAFGTPPQSPNPLKSDKWYIYYATWEEWGHGPSCGGWGLCNYWDCWFCDVDNRAGKHTGRVYYNDDTNEAYMIIELDQSEPIQIEAIEKKLDFTVSKDIDNPKSILHEGIYKFDPGIGKLGGYKLKITIKK